MADVTVQSSFPGTIGTAAQADDARRVNAPLPFAFTAWKDAIDARLVNAPFILDGTPQQARNKAISMRLDQALGDVVGSKITVSRGFSHPDVFDVVERPLTGHLFP